MFENIPNVKLGLIAVSRDCFPRTLSEMRRANIAKACEGGVYECPVTVENEADLLRAVADVKAADCNALVVFLGNFGPETPETLIAKYFDGPCMFVAAAEGDGDLINGRGDAYCGMLNCSYNLGMRHLKGYIPEYPVGTAADIAKMIADFIPIARAVIGVKNLKIITFGPRPQDFFACNAPIKGLYELGVEIEENSELDLLVSYKAHAGDARIPAVCEAGFDNFRGGGFSSHFVTRAEMPATMIRLNLVKGLGPVLQIAEGWTVKLPDEVTDTLMERTNPTWPCTWFTPRCDGKAGSPFESAYSVMQNWGANHGAISYGHVGADLITLCSMLRIPVCMHNVADKDVFRPAAWNAFGMDKEGQDYRACAAEPAKQKRRADARLFSGRLRKKLFAFPVGYCTIKQGIPTGATRHPIHGVIQFAQHTTGF